MKKNTYSALVICLLLTACQSSFISETSTLTATSTTTPTFIPTATQTPEPTLTPNVTQTPEQDSVTQPPALVHRVLILSIDGFRPDAMPLAPMPILTDLLESSAYTLAAQTVYPSVTLISHASMLSGLCPAKHEVTWNDYLPELGYAKGTDLFDIAHAAGLKTVMYVGKDKLRQVTEPESTDIFEYINDRDLVIIEKLIENFPADFDLMFVHFPTPDGMGHEYGWLSPEQLSVLYRADQAIGNLLEELDARGIREETLFIVTADHGGHDQTHGSSLPEDMTIPWIANGAGIKPGQLTSPVHTIDMAATAAYALGLPIPAEWDGVPVFEAFGLPVEKESVQCVK